MLQHVPACLPQSTEAKGGVVQDPCQLFVPTSTTSTAVAVAAGSSPEGVHSRVGR